MKKYFAIAIIVLLASALFWTKLIKKQSLYPASPFDIIVTYNQGKIETEIYSYNWCDEPNGGCTHEPDDPVKLVKNLKTTSVKKDEEIKFTFDTSWKQPKETSVYLIRPDLGLDKQFENTNSFNAPKEKGEYIFLISGLWDEGHNATYVFKMNVID